MSHSLIELRAAQQLLRDAMAEMDPTLVARGVPEPIRARLGETAQDILDAALVLEEVHPSAKAAQDEHTQRLFELLPPRIPPAGSETWPTEQVAAWFAAQPAPTPEEWNEATELMKNGLSVPYAKAKVAYKAVLFFVRAFQDALYHAFLSSRGERPGKDSSMAGALKSGKPLSSLLSDAVPDYRDWFFRWRRKRNYAKEGVGIAFTGIGGFGLLFQSVTDEGTLTTDLSQAPLSLPDVVEALEMSAAATDAVAAYVKGWPHGEE